jgi:hypothetical protein
LRPAWLLVVRCGTCWQRHITTGGASTLQSAEPDTTAESISTDPTTVRT